MSRSRIAVAAVAAALLAALPVSAQEAKAPAAPAPAAKPAPAPAAKAAPAPAAKPAPAPAAKAGPAKPAATELARILMPKKTWSEGLDQLGRMVQMRMQGGHAVQLEFPKDFQPKVKAELEAALPYEELIGLHAKELGAAFNDGELGDMLAFYRSPTGQKALVKMGEVQNTVGLETQKRIEGKMPEIMKKLSGMAKAPPEKKAGKADAKGKAAPGAKPAGHP